MFEHFSFACASRQHGFCPPYPMDDTVSPTSSRESTPCYDAGCPAAPERGGCPLATSIAELSHHFDQHTLAPQRRPPSLCVVEGPPPHRAREPMNHHPPPHHSPTSFSNRICRRRPSLGRLQCSSDHLSRISALVEEMVQTGQPLYEPGRPAAAALLDDSLSPSLSPDERPPMASSSPMASYFNLSSPRPSSSFGATCEPRFPRHTQSYKVEKEPRQRASKEGVGKPMVRKKIRMRKSLKGLDGGAKR